MGLRPKHSLAEIRSRFFADPCKARLAKSQYMQIIKMSSPILGMPANVQKDRARTRPKPSLQTVGIKKNVA